MNQLESDLECRVPTVIAMKRPKAQMRRCFTVLQPRMERCLAMTRQGIALLLIMVLALPPVGVGEEVVRNPLDTRVSFDVTEADVGGVLKTLAEAFDLNIVVGEGIEGAVSLSLNDVRLEDALDLILQTTGYYYTMRDNIIMVQAPGKTLATEVVMLEFIKASEIKSSLEALLSEQGSIVESADDDRIIVKEMPKQMKAILKQIRKLDHPPRQVLIEARIIEVEDTDLTAFGVTWNSNLNLAGTTDGKAPLGSRTILPPSTGTAVASDTTTSNASSDFRLKLAETSADLTGGQLVYGLTWKRAHIATTIDALVRTNRAHILASPTIAAMDGEEAKIIIGEKFPFRENTLTAVGTTETTKFVDIGTALRVLPNILNDEDVLLEIHPEVSSLNESLTAGPRINTREANTKMILKNGQSVVIAGLIQHDKTVIRQKVPFFGNLPLVGLAFRNRSSDFVRKELVVFITVYILRPFVGEEGEPVVDLFSGQRFYNRAVRLTQEFGIESLGKSEAQRYSEAIANFKTVVRNFPETELADDALYQLGKLYHEKMKKPDKAAEVWHQLVTQFPDSPYATSDLYNRIKKLRKQAEGKAKERVKKFGGL